MEKTVNEVFRNRVNRYGDRLAVEKKIDGSWQTATWNEYYQRARSVGLGLYDLGVRRGDRIGILSENRLEWIYTDMGGLGIGACVVPVYPTIPAAEVAYLLDNCGAKVLVVENQNLLEKAVEALEKCPALEKVVVVDPTGADLEDPRLMTFALLTDLGTAAHASHPERFEALSQAVAPEDLLTIQYTSGTTGVPKGAMLTHGVVMAALAALNAVTPPYGVETDNVVGFLPLSHIFERVPVHYYILYKGITKSYAESLETIAADIQEKRPTILFGVPRVHEKIYNKMLMTIKEKPPVVQKLFAWAQRVGAAVSRCNRRKAPVPLGLRIKHRIAYKLVFKKLQDALGGRVRWFCAAGGPIATEVVNFFNAAGIFVLEGYGMSEAAGGVTLSNLDDFNPGSVGRPLPGFDVRIAEDGEIEIKGGSLFTGYWRMESETRDAFTADGYFKTGDIGRFDEEGMLFITDRKKDLIITSGGKNIAPQKIEALFKNHPLFAQFLVVGEARNYLTAIVELNLDVAAGLAEENGIAFTAPRDLVGDPCFKEVVDAVVAERNRHLGRYETIKQYIIVDSEFSIAGGELTPSMKLKRQVVLDKYRQAIEAMYETVR